MKKYVIESDWTYKGLRCLVVFNGNTGFRCGYVGIPKGNPFYKKPDLECEFDVHGGITYDETNAQYPIPLRNVRWVGFDCGHYGDNPDFESLKHYVNTGKIDIPARQLSAIEQVHLSMFDEEAENWDTGAVGIEVEGLADQIAISRAEMIVKNLEEGKSLKDACEGV